MKDSIRKGAIEARLKMRDRALNRAIGFEQRAREDPLIADYFQAKVEKNLEIASRCEKQILALAK